MTTDFIMNGQGTGTVASRLLQNMDAHGNIDHNCLRPMIGEDGRAYIVRNVAGKPTMVPVHNADATLRKDDWKLLDDVILKAARPKLKAFGDLRRAGLTYSVPNAMGKTVLESENMSDIGPATVSMDGLARGANDRPVFDIVGIPLPIIHKDFSFSLRQIAASRNGTPLDTTQAGLAAEQVATYVEQQTLGVASAYTYGGYTIQGYTNYTNRMTKTLTAPTDAGWTPALHVRQILQMKQQSVDAYHTGPWFFYTSPAWDQYYDEDYSGAKGEGTLRDRLSKIKNVDAPETLDYLTGYQCLLVQKSQNVVRAVVGMDITTVQWESHGGMQMNFKVMCILLTQLRTDQNTRTGLVHGSS
jgi:hypothetical protein